MLEADKVVLRLVGYYPSAAHPIYLVSCDVDARGGRGTEEVTRDPNKAMLFDDAGAALEYWRRQSNVTPMRPDGKPNRPLTAFTVEIMTLGKSVLEKLMGERS